MGLSLLGQNSIQKISKAMVIISTIIFLSFIEIFGCSIGSLNINTGAEKIIIEGGKKGNVPFAHRLHQKQLSDCNICHSYFPQKAGAIKYLKNNGQLKKKQLMKSLCIKCHKTEKNAGNPSGPTTCSKCHIK